MRTLADSPFVEALAWDTRHFGRSMGSVRIPPAWVAQPIAQLRADLEALVNTAAAQGYHQLTVRAEPRQVALIHALEEAGFHLVDTLVTLECALDDVRPAPARLEVTIRSAVKADVAALMEIARQAFADRAVWLDRFHADPNIPSDQADDLYAQWVKNSVAPDHPVDTMADATLVAEMEHRIAGFLTCRLVNIDGLPGGVVSLNAVDASCRRRRVYRALAERSLEWFRTRGCRRVRVRTSLISHGVQRTWQRLGAVQVAEEHTFHWWA